MALWKVQSWKGENTSVLGGSISWKGVVNKILKIEEPDLECQEGLKTPYLEGIRNHLAVDQQADKIKRLF